MTNAVCTIRVQSKNYWKSILHTFFVNNLPINNLNFNGFVYRQTELISFGKCKYMDIVGFREYYLRDLWQLVLVSILIVHNQI